MGQSNWITGEAQISPPLDEKVVKKLSDGENLLVGYFKVEEGGEPDRVEMVDGEITVIEGNRAQVLEFGHEESGNFYDFDEACLSLVKAVKKVGSEIHGAFMFLGEDNLSISRNRFDGDKMFSEAPKLVWPNGDEEQL